MVNERRVKLIETVSREASKAFIEEITELGGGDSLNKCLSCGQCVALCPPRAVDPAYRFTKYIRMIKLGLRETLMDDPSTWECTSCNRCTEFCPRQVSPFLTIIAIRRFQSKELSFPMSTLDGVMNLLRTGHGVLSEHGKELRKNVGLPENPPSAIQDPKALEEIKTILIHTKLVDLGVV